MGACTPPLNLPALGRRQPLYVRSSRSQRPVFLVNSRLGLFTAAPVRLTGRIDRDQPGPPFSRSYGVMLPSSLAKVLPFTLAEICRPTSVGLRYGRTGHWLGAFLGGTGIGSSGRRRRRPSAHASGLDSADFPTDSPYAQARTLSIPWRSRSPPRPPIAHNATGAVQEC